MDENKPQEDRQGGLRVHAEPWNSCIKDSWGKCFCIGTKLCFDGYNGKKPYSEESYEGIR